MEGIGFEPGDVEAARSYEAAVLPKLLEAGGRVVPAGHELMHACLAVTVAARWLELTAARRGTPLQLRLDATGWPPVVTAVHEGGAVAHLTAMVGETAMEPRGVWPMLVRDELVTEVTYHAYLGVWLPAHERFAQGRMPAMLRATLAGWTSGAELRTCQRTTVAPHIGNQVGGSFRQLRVAQLRAMDELVDRLAAGRVEDLVG